MRKLFTYLFILIISLTLVSAVPKITPYVNDYANILTPNEITQLNLQVDQIEKNTTYEIAIVTILNTEGMNEIEYANRIGDENGVGKKELSNGMVILLSMETRKIVIGTGRGSEGIINDAKAGRIIDKAVPNFKEGNYYEGFSSILNDLNSEITSKDVVPIVKENPPSPNSDFSWWLLLIPMGLFIFILILKPLLAGEDYSNPDNSEDEDKPKKYKYKKVKGKRKRVYINPIVPIIVASSLSSHHSNSYSSSSSGGFSGGSFSGGSFGGGGASRGF
jgi:uncharacterized protein